MGNTVNRPSQANQQWVNVKDANGNVTLKRNVAYSGRTNRGTGRGVPDARRVANDQPPVNWSLEEMDVLFDGMDMDKARINYHDTAKMLTAWKAEPETDFRVDDDVTSIPDERSGFEESLHEGTAEVH